MLKFRLIFVLLALSNMASARFAHATIESYQSGHFKMHYVMTAPFLSKTQKLPVWIFQPGDGDILSTFSPALGTSVAQLLSSAYGVVFIWPEIRREYVSKDLKVYCDLDFLHRVYDLNALIDKVKLSQKIDPDRIFLIGHSGGAEIVTLTANTRNDLRGIVTLGGGVIQFGDYVRRTHEDDWLPAAEANTCQNEKQYKTRSGQFWREFLYSDLYNQIRRTPQPYLAIMGGRDRVSRIDVQLKELEQMKAEKKNFDYALVEQSKHNFANSASWSLVNRFTKAQ